MVTIKDIAREAGVSCGTVSNVLNAKGNVSSEKINRVQEAIAQLGYEVNEAAKTLRMQRSRTIAVIVPSIRSRHYIEVYETICPSFVDHRPLSLYAGPYSVGAIVYIDC